MKPLGPSDLHHLQAAIGWLELGNHVEANEELEKITAELRGHTDVLGIRWQIYAKAGKWDNCVDIANAVIELEPNRVAAWIDRANALFHARGGSQAAWDSLSPALEKFPAEPLIRFYLACYACQMGRLEEACEWLRKTFALAQEAEAKKRLRLMALDEPTLEPLWQRIGELSALGE